MDELAIARVNAAKDNGSVKPIDLLKAMIHDLETGVITADGLILVYANRPAEKAPWSFGRYVCGMTYDQEIVALHMRLAAITEAWREEGYRE